MGKEHPNIVSDFTRADLRGADLIGTFLSS
ncbi:MAG: pentapeptide repeat-containing protein [Ktedonobacteraceae bacterium]